MKNFSTGLSFSLLHIPLSIRSKIKKTPNRGPFNFQECQNVSDMSEEQITEREKPKIYKGPYMCFSSASYAIQSNSWCKFVFFEAKDWCTCKIQTA